MTTWIALLRGVNVGGNNKVPMGKLRKACEAAGWDRVRSYIASGNLVFEAEGSAEGLAGTLQAILKSDFNVSAPALVVSGSTLRAILSARPLEPVEGKQLHAFLTFGVPAVDRAEFAAHATATETLHQTDGAVWLHTPDGFGRSTVAGKMERVIKGTQVTARNLNPLRALVEMLDDLA
jgi:uncharacterized protein (DUF1697 family)